MHGNISVLLSQSAFAKTDGHKRIIEVR